jgi:hypothetical protein
LTTVCFDFIDLYQYGTDYDYFISFLTCAKEVNQDTGFQFYGDSTYNALAQACVVGYSLEYTDDFLDRSGYCLPFACVAYGEFFTGHDGTDDISYAPVCYQYFPNYECLLTPDDILFTLPSLLKLSQNLCLAGAIFGIFYFISTLFTNHVIEVDSEEEEKKLVQDQLPSSSNSK